jgi:hypothetical protein
MPSAAPLVVVAPPGLDLLPARFAKGCPGNIAYCREPERKEKPKDETQIRLALQGSAIALQPLCLGFFAARLLFFSQYCVHIAQKFVRIRRLRLQLHGSLLKGHSLLGSILQAKHAPQQQICSVIIGVELEGSLVLLHCVAGAIDFVIS